MTAKKELKRQFDELLILEVEARNILYDVRSRDYKDHSKRREAWAAVNVAIGGVSAEQCQSRFQYLRGEYSRLKRALKTKSGQAARDAEISISTNAVYKQMRFLDDFIVQRKTSSNIVLSDNTKENLPTMTATCSYSQSVSDLEDNDENCSAREKALSNKRRRSSSFEGKMDETFRLCVDLLKKEEKDESARYAELLAQELRSMPDNLRQFALFKHQELQYFIRSGIISPDRLSESIHDSSFVSESFMQLS